MTRVIRLLEEWLPLLAGLSGVVVPICDERCDHEGTPSLDGQLAEILDFIALQERKARSARPRWPAAHPRP